MKRQIVTYRDRDYSCIKEYIVKDRLSIGVGSLISWLVVLAWLCLVNKMLTPQLWQDNKADNAKLETDLALMKQNLEKTQKRLISYNQKVRMSHCQSVRSLLSISNHPRPGSTHFCRI